MKSAPGVTPDLLVLTRHQREDDVAPSKPLEWRLVWRLWTYTRPHRRKRNLLVIFTIIRACQLPALAWAVGAIISGPVADHDMSRLGWGVLGYLTLALTTEALLHFRHRYALELGEAVVNALRTEIFTRLQRMPLSFVNRVKVGRIIGHVTSDVESVRIGIQDVVFISTIQGGTMLVAAAIMLACDPVMFLVVAALAPVLWLLNRHFRARLSQSSRAASESFSQVTATLTESVNGIRVTQGFSRQATNAALFRGLLANHARYNIAVGQISAILTPLLELNSQFFIAVLLLLGGWRAFNGEMDLGRLIQFLFLANYFFSPIQVIGNQYNQAITAMASAERLFRLIDAEPDWEDAPNAQPLPGSRVAGYEPTAGLRVEFRNVTFGYDPANPVVHGLEFIAEPGQSVALVGHTGSGKSTVIGLTAKFYLPTAGEIWLDGREIRTVASGSLHRQIGLVQQQNFLFTGTVAQNIRFGRPEATDTEIVAVLRQLDCLDLLEALPGGIHASVGEKGGKLSLGQRQLVCYARALLANPRLLAFDEATSAIDTFTEARLQKALATLLKGRTSFIVAHRLSTVRQADIILVLDRGRIVERGGHQALLKQGGQYAALYKRFVKT